MDAIEYAGQVAKATRHEYERLLQKEEEPELLVILPKQVHANKVLEPMLDAKLKIRYSVSNTHSGIHFGKGIAFTDNEVQHLSSSNLNGCKVASVKVQNMHCNAFILKLQPTE